MAAFDRLVRFEAQDGKTYFGDLGKEEVPTREIMGRKVTVLEGSVESGFTKTGDEATISKVWHFQSHAQSSVSRLLNSQA
jgi:transcription initiation factor TFIIH subunit 2